MRTARKAGTKIVVTLGPASVGAEMLERLVRAGVDVVRLNFSHGKREEHAAAVERIRRIREWLDLPVAILGDLAGPKIRLLGVEGGTVELPSGQATWLVADQIPATAERLTVNQPEMLEDVKVGDPVLIDDGNVRLRVVERQADGLRCAVEVGGEVSSRKGLNLPETDLRVASLTDKDRLDATWAVEAGVDYLALSFVRRAQDLADLRDLLESLSAHCQIIAKVETRRAIDHLDPIINAADGVMVARGDLGVEVDVATVPRLQKQMVQICRRTGKPVIVATQMLQSMVDSPTPTRAEVSDVANAIYDGADAVMLSAETAVGRFPVRAVEVLERVALETEAHDSASAPLIVFEDRGLGVAASVAASACDIAQRISAAAVVVWTETGTMARLVSKHRLDRPTISLMESPNVRRRCALYYGIIPEQIDKPRDPDELAAAADRILLEKKMAKPGNTIVIGFGAGSLASGRTGGVLLHEVGPD